MKNIITVTLNPAIDIHIDLPSEDSRLEEGGVTRIDMAGKGVNVSKALVVSGYESSCYVMLGKDGAQKYLSGLAESGFSILFDTVDGEVRQNLHIHTPAGDRVDAGVGAAVLACELESMKKRLQRLIVPGSVLCFSGSIAAGSDKGAVIESLIWARELGAELFVDSRSFDLYDISRIRPRLIKPNLTEAQSLLGYEITDENIHTALAALRQGGAEQVLLTFGEGGLALATERGTVVKRGVCIDPISTTGAGDSTLAACIIARLLNFSDDETAELALAFGTAACVTAGSEPPPLLQIKSFYGGRNFIKEADISV